jgi:hypothetical protein
MQCNFGGGVRLEKNSVRTERVRWEGGVGGLCSIKPAPGLANGNGDGGTGDRCAKVYACSVCGGTEAIKRVKRQGQARQPLHSLIGIVVGNQTG